MRSVVIGGGGFIGSHITEVLLRAGNEVIVFDRPGARYSDMFEGKGAKIVQGSFLDDHDIQNALTGAENVFHLVSTTVPKTSNDNPIFDIQTNLVGTVNLLNAARKAGVKRVIFASSGGTVYGIPMEIPIGEGHPTNPICSYGIVKLAIEKYLQLFWELYDIDFRILRIANAYGERQPMSGSQGVLPMIIGNALMGKSIHIWGDGSIIRDYVYVSDIAEAFHKVSLYTGERRIFNIGNGFGLSINDLLRITQNILGQPLNVTFEKGQPYDVPVNILDATIANQLLNWHPKVTIDEGILKTINYQRGKIKEMW